MKKIVLTLLSSLLLLVGTPTRAQIPSPSAGLEALILALLEKWQGTQDAQMVSDAKLALDHFSTQLETFEKAKDMAKIMKTVAGKIDTAYMVKNEMEQLVNYNRSIYNNCISAYNWTQQKLASGDISPRDAVSMHLMLDNIYRMAGYDLDMLLKMIGSSNTGLTIGERLRELVAKRKMAEARSQAISMKVDDLSDDIMTRVAAEALAQYLNNAYGITRGSTFQVPTLEQARKDVNAVLTKGGNNTDDETYEINSDGGKAAEDVAKKLRTVETGNSILNVVCAIIGLLAVFMSIPAYFKVTKGEIQSQDALYKLFMGTVGIIFIIQVFGKFILSVV